MRTPNKSITSCFIPSSIHSLTGSCLYFAYSALFKISWQYGSFFVSTILFIFFRKVIVLEWHILDKSIFFPPSMTTTGLDLAS